MTTVVVVSVVRSPSWTRARRAADGSRPPTAALRANESVAWSGVGFVQVNLGDFQVLVPVASPPSSPPSVV